MSIHRLIRIKLYERLQVDEITAMAKGRLELAKALIRASEKSSKPKKKAAENPGDAATAKQPSA